jgi:hypothetical protein
MLLEEHPLQRFGAFDPRLRGQRCAAADIPEDGVGLGEITSLGDFQQRYLSAGVLLQEIRRAALAPHKVHIDRIKGSG